MTPCWLKFLKDRNHRLPTEAGKQSEAVHTRPDFFYKDEGTAVYIDGQPHDHADRQARDAEQQRSMENLGHTVLRFRHDEEWEPLLKKYPSVFGTRC
jgi:very-short-patch-repair endonuclease